MDVREYFIETNELNVSQELTDTATHTLTEKQLPKKSQNFFVLFFSTNNNDNKKKPESVVLLDTTTTKILN